VVLLAAVVALWPRAPEPAPAARPVVTAAPAPEPEEAPAAPAPAAPAPAEPAQPPAPEPAHHKPAQAAPSPNGKSFDRAQKALWTNQPKAARSLMADLLKLRTLTRRDRARASKLMGDAEARLGNKAKAAAWYRKSFQLYDDPEERAKVARLLQGR
jgi:hypothetical protein